MTNPHSIRTRGTIVARSGTTRLFVENPEHYYAVGNADRVKLQIGDEVEIEATVGDQFATVTAVNGRRLP